MFNNDAINHFRSKLRERQKFDAFISLSDPLRAHYAAKLLRKKLETNTDSGNIGVAHLLTHDKQWQAQTFSSGKHEYNPSNAKLKGLTAEDGSEWRWSCTEFQILNKIVDTFSGDSIGHLSLYTENAPCASCSAVISQFMNHFPKIRIGVIYEKGSEYTSEWQQALSSYPDEIRQRIRTKKFLFTDAGRFFEVGRWYAFVDRMGAREIFKLLNSCATGDTNIYSPSRWQDKDGNIYLDLEIYSTGKDIFLTTRDGKKDNPLPYSKSWLSAAMW